MKNNKLPAITAVSGALASTQSGTAEPHAHVFVTFTTNRTVPLSGLRREAMRLRRAVRAGGVRIRSIEFGPLNLKAKARK